MYRVKVYGRSVSGPFGCDIFEINSPADVVDTDGVLVIKTRPTPHIPAEPPVPGGRAGRPARKATNGSQVCYPRGGWSKVIVTDYIDDNVVTNPSL